MAYYLVEQLPFFFFYIFISCTISTCSVAEYAYRLARQAETLATDMHDIHHMYIWYGNLSIFLKIYWFA